MNTCMPVDSKLIDGFDTMTKQQLLDLSVAHLLSTRKPSIREHTDACIYAGSGCGAAPFIKEQFRDEADQQGNWHGVANMFGTSHEKDFILALQRAHDVAWNSARDSRNAAEGTTNTKYSIWFEVWKSNIKMIALATSLTCPADFY